MDPHELSSNRIPDVVDQTPNAADSLQTKKYRLWIVRLFLKTDYKHPKIWKPLRTSKESLLRNMEQNIVPLDDINDIFWIYADINKHIPVHKFLKPHLPKFFVRIGNLTLSVTDYLFLLRTVKTILDPIRCNYQSWQKISLHCLETKYDASDDVRTELEFDVYKKDLRSQLRQLYAKTYTPALLQAQEEHLLMGFANGTASFSDVAQYIILHSFSVSDTKDSLPHLDPYLDQPVNCGLSAPLPLSQVLALLSSLEFTDRAFAIV